MANIMSQLKFRNKPSRNGFDLSKKNAFTAKVGELLPVYCKEVLPGDKFNINAKWLSRTAPVNTAAYTRIREYYDFFFVPTNLLWNRFGTFVTNQLYNEQNATSLTTTNILQDKQPYFTCNQIVDYLTAIGEQTNQLGFQRRALTAKLLEYLGYGDYEGSWSTADLKPRENVELNPFPLLAYQKIYQDYFRDNQWELAQSHTCNVNYITGATGTSLNIPISTLPTDLNYSNLFDLRYSNWNKDYFMGLMPKTQSGAAAIIEPTEVTSVAGLKLRSSGQGALISEQTAISSPYPNRVVAGTSDMFGFSDDSIRRIQDAMGKYTILALRQAQAKQKWAEITQSQRRDYKSQVSAHFGVNMSDAYSEFSTFIGGINGNIDISEVVNTNITDMNESDIAGKGVGVGQGSINFTAQTHGYIMCIYHAVPLLDYAVDGIKRQNLKTTFMDYAIPEFDATGMVSVPTIELTNRKVNSLTQSGTLLGYAPRYIDYKTDIDEVHGAFVGTRADWVAPISTSYILDWIEQTSGGGFNGLNYLFLKVNPGVLNPIFGVNAGSGTDTDQLLVNAYFDVKAVRNLDVNGLPY